MAKNQLLWLIKEEDLILSNEPKEVTVPITLNITETGPRNGTIPIYAYDGDRDRLPDRLANAENELTRFHVINYDLKDIPLQEITRSNHVGPYAFYVAELSLTMSLPVASRDILHVEVR
ncbi:hypothetical protein NA56DRAFT_447313 [Hyaloscypha hepaticicola]|uniref:Uncharacterized protein n=1 Tax=Hyaloscypha hepaticicola TaxID=2082293 RepID=A0A2J6PG58_9HELO|nr:hypothetical protein NA56DRAFT_447313 [Hyaloscypha hepaticicola]